VKVTAAEQAAVPLLRVQAAELNENALPVMLSVGADVTLVMLAVKAYVADAPTLMEPKSCKVVARASGPVAKLSHAKSPQSQRSRTPRRTKL